MESRVEEAVSKKQSGKYNCAQAIACTYCDILDMDEENMKYITQAFAVGMGTMEGNCGAITGAGIILGIINKNQIKTFKDIRTLMTKFKERNSTVICKELKGIGTGKVLRECNDCVRDMAEFLEEQINFKNM